MQQTRSQPLYWAKDRVPFNLTLFLALGIAVWGILGTFELIPPPGNPTMIIILGVGVSLYTWLFTPREYLVYEDSLCVAYGRPRVKVMHFSNISVVEVGSLASLDQLRVRPVRGRRQSIRVRDPDTFFEHLEAALNAYRDAHPGENLDFQISGRPMMPQDPAGVIDVEPVQTVYTRTETAEYMAEAATPPTADGESSEDEPAEVQVTATETETPISPELDAAQADPPKAKAGEEEDKPPEHRPLY